MSRRDYNKLYLFGRLALQVIQFGQNSGLLIRLIPSITFASNNRDLLVGFSFEWLAGDINIGIANKSLIASERERKNAVDIAASKVGITPKQQRLRWGW